MLSNLRQRLVPACLVIQCNSRSISYKESPPPYPLKKNSPLEGNKEYKYGRGAPNEMKIDLDNLRLYNKRHIREHKRMLFKKFEKRDSKYSHIYEHKYGTRGTGIRHAEFWEHVPEKVPELIVPDLTDCPLKPYVSYKAKEVEQVSKKLCVIFLLM